MTTLIIGAFITAFISGCIILAGAYVKYSPRLRLNRAYHRNCVEDAELKFVSEDETRQLFTATYSYQYRGEHFDYMKHYFGSEPPTHLKLWWDAKKPAEAIEVDEDEPMSRMVIYLPFGTTVLVFLAALFMPQLALIFLAGTVAAWINRHYLSAKILIAIGCFAIFTATGLWMEANVDPQAYEYVSYRIERIDATRMQLKILDQLEPWEIAFLYEDVYYYNSDIKSAAAGRKSPIMGQFANKHLAEQEPLQWPEEYARYADHDYRTKILKEAGKW